ncbi:MAG: polysaccharide deacetylase family protein [Acidobacteriota bacterium]
MRSVWLMYHDVYRTAPVEGIPRSASLYHVSADAFASHLGAIERSGLRVVSARECLSGPGDADDSAVLTFDDGWQGTFDVAMPLLAARGWQATVFVTRDFLGRKGFASAAALRDAAAAGMEIGVHGVTHRMLSACSHAEVVAEFRGCKDYLEGLLGQAVDHASVPGGDATRAVVAGAREAGMRSLATSQPGVNGAGTSPHHLRRVAIKESTTVADVDRYGRLDAGRERARYALLRMPQTILGMKRYSKLRRVLMRTPGGHEVKVFEP